MPRLVVVSRYLKGGSKKVSNYVKYIASREGAATVKENNGTAPATQKQLELILSLLKDFPESKKSIAYEKYKNSSTQKNASEFVLETIRLHADIAANKKNYVGYLANRPGAVKFGSHGLFSQTDEPIDLEKTAKEISEHKGNVWTHVVSLRRDDAQKMGYDDLTAWRELVKRQIPNIAKQSKIKMGNLKWYAAFHDKETNPHVHIVVYSTNEREGFLTKQGCEKIRSGFMNDIYTDELKHLYQQQTDVSVDALCFDGPSGVVPGAESRSLCFLAGCSPFLLAHGRQETDGNTVLLNLVFGIVRILLLVNAPAQIRIPGSVFPQPSAQAGVVGRDGDGVTALVVEQDGFFFIFCESANHGISSLKK